MRKVIDGVHARPVALGAVVAVGISAAAWLVGYLVDSATPGEVGAGWWVLAVVLALVVAAADGIRVSLQASDALEGESVYRQRTIQSIFRLGAARVSADRRGRLVSMATDGAERVGIYRDSFKSEVAAAASQVLIYLLFIGIAVNPLVSFGLALGAVLTGLGIWGFMRWHRKSSAGNRQARGAVAASYLEAINALETLALLRATGRVSADLEKVGEKQRRETMSLLARNQRLLLVIDLLVHGVFLGLGVALTVVATYLDWVSMGAGLTAILLTVFLIEPVDLVGSFFYIAMAGRGIERGMLGLQKSAQRVPDFADPRPPLTEPPAIRVRDLGYTYANSGGHPGNKREAKESNARAVLASVDLDIEPGTQVAITGPSGVGKTTLLNILAGRLPIQSGRIEMGPYSFISEDDAGRQELAAFVAQDTWLMTGSLRDNLEFARPGATDAQMWDALEKAHVAEEMRLLPDGLDTVLGEDGASLSGGQAQRVALARAYLSGRPLIIADEPTAHVDMQSQREIMGSLEDARGDHTIVVVTHREALANAADRVIRMEPDAEAVRGGGDD